MTLILIADDHVLLRESLVSCLVHAMPDVKVTQANSLQEALAVAERLQKAQTPLSLALLDLRMPGMHGLEGMIRFREQYPNIPVALLSGLAEMTHITQAQTLGAVGYFPKTQKAKAFVEGVHIVLRGQSFWPKGPDGVSFVPAYNHNGDGPWHPEGLAPIFSAREQDVITYLVRGLSNKVIAAEMHIQEVTVKMHLRHICAKLGVTNRTQAALRLRDLGLIHDE